MIEVELLGQKKYTSTKDDIGGGTALCTWNEHIFFEPRNVVSFIIIILNTFRKKRILKRPRSQSAFWTRAISRTQSSDCMTLMCHTYTLWQNTLCCIDG
jgi:hypothetical protein